MDRQNIHGGQIERGLRGLGPNILDSPWTEETVTDHLGGDQIWWSPTENTLFSDIIYCRLVAKM